ncbi:MAG: hypothetical protein ACREV6_16815 [Clostridium sp.]|uniref:hypothetical protein n=1 Tax=Clostridium sp. TaxID=1506 RepID=UPI003D6D0E3A
MNEIQNDPKEKHKESRIFTILAIIFFVIGTLISLLQLLVNDNISLKTTNLARQSGYIIGSIIARILIVAFLVCLARFAFKKKKGRSLMILSIVFLMVSGITTISAFAARGKENRLNKVAMAKLITICRDYAGGKDLNSQKLDKSKYGSIAPFLDLSNQYFISFKKLSSDMNTEMLKFNLVTILGTDTYSSSDKMNDAQKRVRTLLMSLDRFESNADKITKTMKVDLNNLDIPIRYKQDVVAGVEKGQIKSSGIIKNYILFEKNFIKKVDENISFMLKSKENYEVKNNMIYFSSDDDMTKYNQFITDVQELAKEEASITSKMRKNGNQEIDTLENLNK